LILNHVASVAEAVEDIAFGTANGPTRFGPLVRAVSAASTMVRVEGPPEPMMMPVRTFDTSPSSSPASRIACSMATWFQAVPPPWKRMARRSTPSSGLRDGAPCTWQRKPSFSYVSDLVMPDFASRNEASTSWVLLPMDDTMPIPVTTTRLIPCSQPGSARPSGARSACSTSGRPQRDRADCVRSLKIGSAYSQSFGQNNDRGRIEEAGAA
jgi:hypothetical protein